MSYAHRHILVDTYWKLDSIMEYFSQFKQIGFDIETTGLAWWSGRQPTGFGFGALEHDGKVITTAYIPVHHPGFEGCLDHERVVNEIRPILENEKISKIGANIKFDMHFMRECKVEVVNVHDVQVMARLVRSDYPKVALDVLIDAEFDTEHKEWLELIQWCKANKIKGVNKREVADGAYAKVAPSVLGRYCGADIYWTILLAVKYFADLKNDPKLMALYKRVEQPLISAVLRMEEAGITIDVPYFREKKEVLSKLLLDLEIQIYDLAGKRFNILSTSQLKPMLVSLGVEPEMRRRKKKNETIETPSYDKKVLEKRRKEFPLIDKIMRYRMLNTIYSTFVVGLLDRAGQGNSVHTDIRQSAARTGRLGSAAPNLMNLPREDEVRAEFSIRQGIIPRSGKSFLLSIDFSQIEYRLLAHFSNDKTLCAIFERGEDFHAYVASQLFDKSITELTKEERAVGKKFNFAQLYGSGEEHLAAQCNVSLDRVRSLLRLYESKFSSISGFKLNVESYCRKHHGIRNPFGRFRNLPRDLSYRAVNSLIQSTAADMFKIAICRVDKFLRNKHTRLLLPVHDELLFDYFYEDGEIVSEITKLMTTFRRGGEPMFRVPIEVSVDECVGNWGVKKELDLKSILQMELAWRNSDGWNGGLPKMQGQLTCAGE